MSVTIDVSSLRWMSNTVGLWATRIDDLSGNTVVFSEGYTPTVSGKLVKVSNSARPTGTITYASNTQVSPSAPLFKIGNSADTEDVVSGSRTQSIASVDLSTLTWTEEEGVWSAEVSDIKSSTSNVICSNSAYEPTVNGTTVSIVASSSPTGTMWYELATAVTTTTTGVNIALETGNNTLVQEYGSIPDTNATLNYDGTDYDIQLNSGRKYAYSDNGVKSIITESSDLKRTVIGEDMLVDVTQLLNGDSTKIAAVTGWDDISAKYPEYAGSVAYNTGQVVGSNATWKVNNDDTVTPSASLFGINSVKDTEDIEIGRRRQRIGNVDLSTLDWTEDSGTYTATLSGIKANTTNVMSAKGYTVSVSGTAISITSTSAPTGMLYYELAEAIETNVTQQPVTLQSGSNVIQQTAGNISSTSATMDYTGTDYTIATTASHEYLKRINGADSVVTGVSSIAVRGGRDQLTDLTRWFGSGSEPANVVDFYSLFPQLRQGMAYNTGEGVNFKGTGIRTTGFNQWNGAYSETGYFLTNTGAKTANANYNISDYIRVAPAVPDGYYLNKARGSAPSICWYTYDKQFISGVNYNSSNATVGMAFASPANAYWCRFSVYVPEAQETCLHLQWGAYRNGEYELYREFDRNIPVATYFPDGMNGVGSVYDELSADRAVKRIGVVDMSTLTWTAGTGVYTTTISDIASGTANITTEKDYAMSVSGTTVTVTANASPTGLLFYELANPITTVIDPPLPMTYHYEDFGTEEILPVNTATLLTTPALLDIVYQMDFTRTIARGDKLWMNQSTMENLLAILGQKLGGTWELVWNDNTNAYDIEVTE